MQVVMAGPAQPCDAVLNLLPFKVPFIALVGVASARNEMMPGKHQDVATTKFASVGFVHFRTRYIKSLNYIPAGAKQAADTPHALR
jgi:hypothetical protein